METISTGAGFAAMGFWLFIAIIIAAGVWDSIRKRDAQHETLRRAIESGNPIDEELTDKLLNLSGDAKQVDRDLKVAGIIVLSLAPGLTLMGWIMSVFLAAKLFGVMLAVSGLMLFLGAGLLGAAYVVSKSYSGKDGNSGRRLA